MYGIYGYNSFKTAMRKDDSGKVPNASTLITSQMVPLQRHAVFKERRAGQPTLQMLADLSGSVLSVRPKRQPGRKLIVSEARWITYLTLR